MKRSRFSEEQLIGILREAEKGKGPSMPTFPETTSCEKLV